MEVFRLPDLDLTLLEKVIAKLDQTSYFRMQQTCKDIQQFIRKNKNISIHLDGEKHYPFTRIAQRVHYNWIECLPKLEFDKIGNSYKLNFGTHRHPSHCLELADFYGTRLPHIQLSNGIEDCQRICDTLKKYQITTQAIWVSGKDWSREDVLLVLNIVKPYRILLDVYEYELLFQFKSIKEVVINLHEEDVTIAIPKLLDAFPDIDITIENVENEVELIRTCVQVHFLIKMTEFQLNNLDPTLIEKVITKLDPRSYFRMQQTCKDIYKLIRKNKNISVHMDYDFCYKRGAEYGTTEYWEEPFLAFNESDDGCKLKFTDFNHEIDIADLYGTHNVKECTRICDCLKKYRITVREFWFSCEEWSKKEITTLLSIANPRKVLLDICEYETLLQFKSIEEIATCIHEEDVVDATPKMIRAFDNVEISVTDVEDQFKLIHTCLQILRSQAWPKCYFHFRVYGERNLMDTSLDEFSTIFKEYNLTIQKKNSVYNRTVSVEMPQLSSSKTICYFVIFNEGCSVCLTWCN